MNKSRGDSQNRAANRWYYVDSSNNPVGPIPLEEIKKKLIAGELNLKSLMIPEGEAEWLPYRKALRKYRAHIPATMGKYSRSSVLVYLIVAPPMGLVLLWRSPKFRTWSRVFLSILTFFTTLPAFLTFFIVLFFAETENNSSRLPSQSAKHPEKASEPVQSQPARKDSIAYKIASLDAGYPVAESDPAIREFDGLLNDIARVKGIDAERVGDMTWMVKKRLNSDGVSISALELLKAAHKVVMEPSVQANHQNLSYEKLVAQLAALIMAEEQRNR